MYKRATSGKLLTLYDDGILLVVIGLATKVAHHWVALREIRTELVSSQALSGTGMASLESCAIARHTKRPASLN